MPYRTLASPDAIEAADAAEIDGMAREARGRRRRVRLGVAATVLVLMSGILAIRVSTKPAVYLHCHQVEIAWENAPNVPHNTWTACAWR